MSRNVVSTVIRVALVLSVLAGGAWGMKAAWLSDQGLPNGYESSIAKCYATDACMQVTTDAVQIFGGYGYSKEYPVERYMRDAKLMQIYEGANQIQRMVISRSALA